VWGREVLHGVVNLPRIDGKEGVAGSIPAGGSTPNQQARPGLVPGLFPARSPSNRHLPEICQSELYVVIRSEPAVGATPSRLWRSLAIRPMTDPRGVLAMALPSVVVNKPIAGCLGQRFAPLGLLALLQLGACPGRHPAARNRRHRHRRGDCSGAGCARRQALTPSADEANASAEPDDPPDKVTLSSSLVPEGVLLLLRRELDAFREGNYVPISNEHY
jgi:hypothetical protein